MIAAVAGFNETGRVWDGDYPVWVRLQNVAFLIQDGSGLKSTAGMTGSGPRVTRIGGFQMTDVKTDGKFPVSADYETFIPGATESVLCSFARISSGPSSGVRCRNDIIRR